MYHICMLKMIYYNRMFGFVLQRVFTRFDPRCWVRKWHSSTIDSICGAGGNAIQLARLFDKGTVIFVAFKINKTFLYISAYVRWPLKTISTSFKLLSYVSILQISFLWNAKENVFIIFVDIDPEKMMLTQRFMAYLMKLLRIRRNLPRKR